MGIVSSDVYETSQQNRIGAMTIHGSGVYEHSLGNSLAVTITCLSAWSKPLTDLYF